MKKYTKILICILFHLLSLLLVWAFLAPHQKLDLAYTWNRSEQTETANVEWNGTVYTSQTTQPLHQALPRGSYTLTVTALQADDYDSLRVHGDMPVCSIYSNSVSCMLSQYGTEYTIPFENYMEGNQIFLSFYQGTPGIGMNMFDDNGRLDEEAYQEATREYTEQRSRKRPSFTITEIRLESNSLMTWQMLVSCLLVLLLIDFVLLLWKRIDRKKWGILFLLALFASIPLLRGYISYGHDTLFHVSRVEGIKAGLLAGQFPVRISAEQFNGYGYISSALYPELFLYFPAMLRLLNIPLTTTYCIFWFCINLLTAWTAWISFWSLTKSRTGAYAGSALFTLLPYRLSSIYLRGAAGEALALTFFPLILWGVYEVFFGDYRKWPVAVIGYTGVLQSHILTVSSVVLYSVIGGTCCLRALIRNRKRILSLMALIISVFFLNLWFLVPFLELYRLPLWVKHMRNDFLSHVIDPGQLFSVLIHGDGASMPLEAGTAGEMSYSIGLGMILGLILILVVLSGKKAKDSRTRGFYKTAFVCLCVSVLFYWTTTIYFPWRKIEQAFPFVSSFIANLPWRRLGVAGFFLAAAIVFALCCLTPARKKGCLALLIAGCIVSSGSFLHSYMAKNGPFIIDSDTYGKGTEDVLYLLYGTTGSILRTRGNHIDISSPKEVTIDGYAKQYTNISLHYTNTSTILQWIDVPLNYYPGYVAMDSSGLSLPLSFGPNYVLRVTIPEYPEGAITLSYQGRRLYDISLVVSLLYSAGFCWYMWRKGEKSRIL